MGVALVFMILMTATNLFSVKSYGEFEFWFAGIKVAAIVAVIAIGAVSSSVYGRTNRWTSPTCGRMTGSCRWVPA